MVREEGDKPTKKWSENGGHCDTGQWRPQLLLQRSLSQTPPSCCKVIAGGFSLSMTQAAQNPVQSLAQGTTLAEIVNYSRNGFIPVTENLVLQARLGSGCGHVRVYARRSAVFGVGVLQNAAGPDKALQLQHV